MASETVAGKKRRSASGEPRLLAPSFRTRTEQGRRLRVDTGRLVADPAGHQASVLTLTILRRPDGLQTSGRGGIAPSMSIANAPAAQRRPGLGLSPPPPGWGLDRGATVTTPAFTLSVCAASWPRLSTGFAGRELAPRRGRQKVLDLFLSLFEIHATLRFLINRRSGGTEARLA
jgi:hypothetical protein